MEHLPDELPGGPLHRVAIARAMIAKPVVIVADGSLGILESKRGSDVT